MQGDYQNFSEEDFIADEYFQQWVKAPDAERNRFWQTWLAAHPEKRGAVVAAKAFIENLSFKTFIPTPQQVDDSLAGSLHQIEALEEASPVFRIKKGRFRPVRWLAAGALLGSLVIAGLVYRERKPLTIEVVAGPQEIKTITLPDSSLVTLNAGAQISYPSSMHTAASREVWLEGEAFFNVTHMGSAKAPKRFIVHTNDMDIEVLGTTFNVKKRGAVTAVSLNSGKIKIALRDEPEGTIYLQPGDFIRYSSKERKVLKKKVQADLYSVWREKKLSVDNLPLSEIARLLEDTYGYKIEIENKGLADSRISGTLDVKDETTLLETLAFVLNVNIVKKDSVLFFQSKN